MRRRECLLVGRLGSVSLSRQVFASVLIMACAFAGPSCAEIIKIGCKDSTKYEVDTSRNLLSIGQAEESIEWSFDGEWLRLQRQAGRNDVAFGLTTGILIQNGQSGEQFCSFDDPGRVTQLPISSGAWLREVFIALPPTDRRNLQQNLKDFGFYEGPLDGLWGRGTEEGVKVFYEDNKSNLPDGTAITSHNGAVAVFDALAGMISEGDECDGCAEVSDNATAADSSTLAVPPATVAAPSNGGVSSDAPFACNRTPFSEVDWMQRNSRKFNVFAILDEIYDLSADSSPQAGERLREIYVSFDQHMGAAEGYAMALFTNGDYAQAAEWFLRAAEQGSPLSESLTFYIFGQLEEFSGVSPPKTVGTVRNVVEECLRYAVGSGHESAGLTLAKLLISPDDIPAPFAHTNNFNDEEALALLDGMSDELKQENHNEIEALRKIAESRITKKKEELEVQHVQRVNDAQQEAERLSGLCVDAIKIKGVCWAQTPAEMKTVLLARNYTCGTEQGLFGPLERCTLGDASITFLDGTLIFSCANFSACQYSAEELGQMIVDQGLVPELKYNVESFSDGVSTLYTKTYCGRGAKGDELCVNDGTSLLGTQVIEVKLSKSAFGTGGVSFE